MGTMDFAFLHGGGQGGWVWDETIAALNAQSGGSARCLALDAPGCGTKGGRDTSQVVFEDISRELIADIEAAGMKDVVLVGHSQAGMTMPQMAEFAPGLFSRLVFVTCSMPLPGKSTLDQMGNSRHGVKQDEVGWPVDPESSTMEERFRAMFCNDMSPAEGDAFLAKLGSDMWPPVCYSYSDWKTGHLAAIPVSYVLCDRDMALPPPWQEKFAKRLHADRIDHIDAGHQVMNTQPNALAALLLAETGV
ncbi:MAG: alpha/beta fold hydrolase [Novosphingobium sp.]